MLAARGISEADHLYPLFGMPDDILAAVDRNLAARCTDEFRRWLRAASGEEEKKCKGPHGGHGARQVVKGVLSCARHQLAAAQRNAPVRHGSGRIRCVFNPYSIRMLGVHTRGTVR